MYVHYVNEYSQNSPRGVIIALRRQRQLLLTWERNLVAIHSASLRAGKTEKREGERSLHMEKLFLTFPRP